MNSRARFWMVGITAVVMAVTAVSLRRRSSAHAPATKPQAMVETSKIELPPELFLIPNAGPPGPAPLKKGKPPPRDPAARAALSLVGKDTAAEQVWLEAINNPNLPKEERSDLIEDLNEDGFSNRTQPTRADLPLIEARLKLIERLMPEAADETNLDAFGEARKDLINLRTKLSQ